ncbi:hypothetical protein [Paractinoplanes atraurantiacus]|uniref:Uncharacterized protein n=1 Tax=Paractinoplanes atraurantiacus TaxID=1036182 RepID=A0A285KD27_9ACTN|nr:hypothetical protein [Actinoplanes atraurantiacus]SNY70505.1 hypothetical protein SAMN05421748_13798 [Actinoplanes atraurantiacus]
MSELYIRVIPTDPAWQPTRAAATAAAADVAGLFTGPGDDVESVDPVFYEDITVIDGGEYMEDLFCTRCDAEIGLDWFWSLLNARNGGPTIRDLSATTPCCGTTLTLPDLRFEAPIGFARFEVSARNWTRREWELSAEELTAIGSVLGHPVTQVLAHY